MPPRTAKPRRTGRSNVTTACTACRQVKVKVRTPQGFFKLLTERCAMEQRLNVANVDLKISTAITRQVKTGVSKSILSIGLADVLILQIGVKKGYRSLLRAHSTT